MDNICFTPFPNLTTERLNLRQLATEDEDEFFSLRSNENVMRYIERPKPKTIDDVRQFIKVLNNGVIKKENITWAITLKNDTRLIGTIGFVKIMKAHFRAEIGYLLNPDFQRKGIMQEAMTAVMDYGFRVMKLHSIEANVNPNNLSSIKLLERNNFVREAYFKENYYYNGKFLDSAVYSLISNKKHKQEYI